MRRKKIRDQRARTAVEYGAPADVGLHAGPTAPYDPLPAADAQRLIDTTFELMRDVGVGFEPDPKVMSLFSEAGCSVSSEGLVKFDPKLVKQAIASVAKSVKLWNRSGSEFIEIDNRHTWFVSGMTAIQVFDLESGESRSSTRDDLVTITRVADALPNIDAVCMGCKNVERSDIFGEID